MKNFLVASILVVAALASCKKPSAEPEKEHYSELHKAQWLLGRWEHNSAEGNMSETWKQTNDSLMEAAAFVVVGSDTVFSETVKLAQQNGHLSYTVSVPGQNNEKPVSFGLTKSNDNQLVFENPKHDYPNKIIYRKFGNDSIVAEIFGVRNGKAASEQFPMKRVSQNTNSSVR